MQQGPRDLLTVTKTYRAEAINTIEKGDKTQKEMENGQVSHSCKIESKEEKELQSTDHRMK